MILLQCFKFLGMSKSNNSLLLTRIPKGGNFLWNTCLSGSYSTIFVINSRNSFLRKVMTYHYSDEASNIQENLSALLNKQDQSNAIATKTVFEEISNGDPHLLRKLKLIEFEIEVLKQTERNVPQIIKKREWEELASLNSLHGRKKYLNFLFKNEKKTENKLLKKRLRRDDYLRKKEEEPEPSPMNYNIGAQSLFLRIYNKTLNFNLQLRNEAFEDIAQHFIFDCSYQEYMSPMNTKYCAMQLFYCLSEHLYHPYPSLISLYNFKKTDYLYKIFPRYFPTFEQENFSWDIFEESYLDHFPKERLVYLTPHCTEPLETLSPSDCYIIGAFVDKGCGVKASLARAKKYKLRMARLPLDEHVKWRQGSKSLPLNIVMRILLDMKFYKNWSVSLKNLPSRFYDYYPGDVSEVKDILV